MTPTNPVDLINSLDADAIAARLDELERESAALRVLLRSARARQTGAKLKDRHARKKAERVEAQSEALSRRAEKMM